MKALNIIAWVLLAIYAITAAAIYIPNRNATGDRGVGLIIPLMMTPVILLAAAALGFAQYRGWATAVAVMAVLLALPILVVGPGIAGNLLSSYSNKRVQERRGEFRDPVLNEMAVAIRNSDPDKLKTLLAAHPKIDWAARDAVGFTLLGVAFEEARRQTVDRPEHPLCLRLLVAGGAPFQDDAKGRDSKMLTALVTETDETPFMVEMLELMLRAGADPNSKDIEGWPALIGLYMEANKAKALLDAGAELRGLRRSDAEHKDWDALMYATNRARWDLALLYLERGCDPNYQAPDGKSALDLANGVSEETLKYNGERARSQRDAFLRALAAAKAKASPGTNH